MKQPKPKDKRIAILAGYVKRGEFRISQMAAEIGVTEMTVYNWVDGKSGISRLASPRVDMFLRRAKRLIAAQRSSDIAALTGANN